jgi:hypothetical protein
LSACFGGTAFRGSIDSSHRAGAITYRFNETTAGARVESQLPPRYAVSAVQASSDVQIVAHETGDSLEVEVDGALNLR